MQSSDIKLLLCSFTSSMLTILFAILILFVSAKYTLDAGVLYPMRERVIGDDPFVDLVVERCSVEKSDTGKVYCVYNIFTSFFKYEPRNDTKIRTPEYTMTSGGVCRDAVIVYCSVFKRLGLNCSYQVVDKHVFNIIDLADERYCVIDQYNINCY